MRGKSPAAVYLVWFKLEGNDGRRGINKAGALSSVASVIPAVTSKSCRMAGKGSYFGNITPLAEQWKV
jgi:hypothetical protein